MIDPNDYVTVELTAVGAKLINERNQRWNLFPVNGNFKVDYKDGDLYADQLWRLIEDLSPAFGLSRTSPFRNLREGHSDDSQADA